MKTPLTAIGYIALFAVTAGLIYVTSTAQNEARHRVAKATEELAKETHDNTLATAELARVLERQTTPTCRPAKP